MYGYTGVLIDIVELLHTLSALRMHLHTTPLVAMSTPAAALRPLSRTALTTSPALSTSTARLVPRRLRQSIFNRQSPSLSSAPRSPLAARIQTRHSSYHSPEPSPNTPNARKKITMQTLRNLYKKGEPITMITAHDFPSARAADESGMDMVLVGDSLGMVAMGLENTTEVVMEEMLLHCRSVARGAKHAFIVRCLFD